MEAMYTVQFLPPEQIIDEIENVRRTITIPKLFYPKKGLHCTVVYSSLIDRLNEQVMLTDLKRVRFDPFIAEAGKITIFKESHLVLLLKHRGSLLKFYNLMNDIMGDTLKILLTKDMKTLILQCVHLKKFIEVYLMQMHLVVLLG